MSLRIIRTRRTVSADIDGNGGLGRSRPPARAPSYRVRLPWCPQLALLLPQELVT